jgi:predicted porin
MRGRSTGELLVSSISDLVKYLATTAVLTAASGYAHAQSSVTLYGIVDGGITYSNNQSGSAAVQASSGGEGGSRWGLQGTEDLGGGMSTVFKLENGFNLQNGQNLYNGREFGRLAFVGLDTQWGKVTLGRQDDVMGDYLGAYSGSVRFSGPMGTHAGDLDDIYISYKLNNIIKYASPVYNGVSFGGLYGVGGAAGSLATDQLWGLAARYASGPVSVSAVYHHINDPAVTYFDGAAAAQAGTSFVNPVTNPIFKGYSSATSLDAYGLGGSFTFGESVLSANMTTTQFNNVIKTASTPNGGASPSITSVEATYSRHISVPVIVGISVAYTHAEAAKYGQVTLGSEYFLSKRTSLYLVGAWQHATGKDSTGQAAVANLTTISASSTPNQLAMRFGLKETF